MHAPNTHISEEKDYQRIAMHISVWTGVVLFFIKGTALWLTDSTAVLSDAAESVVHLAAMAFAFYSLKVSQAPADEDHPFGHGKIAFFSAGFEGAVILGTALLVFWQAFNTLYNGSEIQHSLLGQFLVGIAGFINGGLGLWLISIGKKKKSIILKANGSHLLTDAWTSGAALLALILISFTGLQWWDPLLAFVITINLSISGFRLVRESIGGLMDEIDPKVLQQAKAILDDECKKFNMSWHDLRIRPNGNGYFIDMHLLFPEGILLQDAHHHATHAELALQKEMGMDVEVLSHLEPSEDHDEHDHNADFGHRHSK